MDCIWMKALLGHPGKDGAADVQAVAWRVAWPWLAEAWPWPMAPHEQSAWAEAPPSEPRVVAQPLLLCALEAQAEHWHAWQEDQHQPVLLVQPQFSK